MRRIVLMMMFAVVTVIGKSIAYTAPKPTDVPSSWQLEIKHQTPKAIRLCLPGQKTPRVFWYMLYTITNKTGADRIFVPEFVLYTDTGQVIHAAKGISPFVFNEIKQIYNNPLLVDRTTITGKLLQGEDNAMESVAIWPDFDPKAGSVDVFIGGLSGETALIELPVPITVTTTNQDNSERQVTTQKVNLSKTLRLRYSIPGEAASRLRASPKLLETDWIMR